MVFVEFIATYGEEKYYFVGDCLDSVLDDTNNGHGFGGCEFASYQTIAPKTAQSLEFKCFNAAISSVLENRAVSWMLGIKKPAALSKL